MFSFTRQLSSASVLALMALLVGCGPSDPHEKVMSQSISCMKDLNDVLDGVKTEVDAKAAVPKVKAIAERLKQTAKDAKALPAPSPDKLKEMQKKYEAQAKAEGERMDKNMKRLDGNMAVMQVLGPSIMEMSGSIVDVTSSIALPPLGK